MGVVPRVVVELDNRMAARFSRVAVATPASSVSAVSRPEHQRLPRRRAFCIAQVKRKCEGRSAESRAYVSILGSTGLDGSSPALRREAVKRQPGASKGGHRMNLHANAALSLNRRWLLCRRVVDDG